MCLALFTTGAFAQSAHRGHHVSATAIAISDSSSFSPFFGGFDNGFGFGGGFGGFGGWGCFDPCGGFGGWGSTTAIAHASVGGWGW
jgi:hypothetical protein